LRMCSCTSPSRSMSRDKDTRASFPSRPTAASISRSNPCAGRAGERTSALDDASQMSDGSMALEVNGTRLYAETVGEGTPTLCLHGGPGTDSSGLVRARAPCPTSRSPPVFYDHRGHGRSRWEPVEQCTQHQLVADMEGVRR